MGRDVIGNENYGGEGDGVRPPEQPASPRRGGCNCIRSRYGTLAARNDKPRRSRVPILWVLDRVVVPVAFGAILVRFGNFMNSEIVGKATNSDFGVVFSKLGEDFPRHPAQLYEAVGYVFVFILLFGTKSIAQETIGFCEVDNSTKHILQLPAIDKLK